MTQWRQLVSCDWSWHSHGSVTPGKFYLKINRSMKTPWQKYSGVPCSYSSALVKTHSISVLPNGELHEAKQTLLKADEQFDHNQFSLRLTEPMRFILWEGAWGQFLKSPETFRVHNFVCIFTTKASRSTNGFSGPKCFWDFRETGPCLSKVPRTFRIWKASSQTSICLFWRAGL